MFLSGKIHCLLIYFFFWNKDNMIKQYGMADFAGQLTIASLSYYTRTVIIYFFLIIPAAKQ